MHVPPAHAVGLLDRAARRIDGIEGAAGRIASLLAGLEILVLIDLLGLEVGKFAVANILQQQRLLAITYDHPIVLVDLQLGHEEPLWQCYAPATARAP